MEEVRRDTATVDVLIIGAGASGLVTAKWMKESGYTVMILERSTAIGGVWKDGGSNIGQRHSLFSKENFRFSDLDYPEGTPELPSKTDVSLYLKTYAQHFNLEPLVKFHREARKLEKRDDGRWQVTAVLNNILEFYVAKYVAVSTGYFTEPNIPYIPGMETFKGESYHSCTFDDNQWTRLDKRRTVIVGIGNSATEIADQAAPRCQSVHLSARTIPWLLPNHLFGHPCDRYTNRISHAVPGRFRQTLLQRSISIAHGQQKKWKMEPKHSSLHAPPVTGQNLLHNVQNGKVKIASAIDRVEGDTVYFEDGTTTQADLIIFCTGYRTECSCLDGFLKSMVINPDTGSFKLYKDVFSPEIGSALAFIGLVEATSLGGLVIAETQARWWAQLCKGTVVLPLKEYMEDSVAADTVRALKHYDGSKRCVKLRDGLTYCDEVSSFYGAKPQWYKHRSLALRLLFSCGGASQYRLQGPDALKEAPDQINSVPIPEVLLWAVVCLVLFFSWVCFASSVTIMEVNDWCDDCLWDD